MRPKSEYLTPAEKAMCSKITKFREKHGRSPSIQELALMFHISRSGIYFHLKNLKAKGALSGPQTIGTWEVTAAGKGTDK